MNKAKRNRLKNKEKIKQLKIKLLNKNSKVTIVKETDKALLEENKLLKEEVRGLHRFISRANVQLDPIMHSFNMPNHDMVKLMSDGAITAVTLDRIRFESYKTNGPFNEPLYVIGLTPEGNSSKEIQASFYLSPDLIRDFPVDYIIEKNLKQILISRKRDLLLRN